MDLLDSQARAEFLASYPDWELEGETISRTFKLKDFSQAMAFVTQVALLSETADHHPDIDIRWNRVKLVLTTHHADGLTHKDTDLAAKINSLV
ncbi:MAG: 4a-hydroxytetrahydrobiopterin dehydratase [Acidimicrobiia bacterium]